MKVSKSMMIVAALVIIVVLGFIYLSRDKSDVNNTGITPNRNVGSNSTTSGEVIAINESSFQSEVLNSDKPVIVDFYADWCGPCKRLAPIMEQLSTEYSGKIKFCKLNVDQNQNLSAKYRIDAIPHLIVFKNGKPVDNIIGLHSKADMQNLLAPLAE